MNTDNENQAFMVECLAVYAGFSEEEANILGGILRFSRERSEDVSLLVKGNVPTEFTAQDLAEKQKDGYLLKLPSVDSDIMSFTRELSGLSKLRFYKFMRESALDYSNSFSDYLLPQLAVCAAGFLSIAENPSPEGREETEPYFGILDFFLRCRGREPLDFDDYLVSVKNEVRAEEPLRLSFYDEKKVVKYLLSDEGQPFMSYLLICHELHFAISNEKFFYISKPYIENELVKTRLALHSDGFQRLSMSGHVKIHDHTLPVFGFESEACVDLITQIEEVSLEAFLEHRFCLLTVWSGKPELNNPLFRFRTLQAQSLDLPDIKTELVEPRFVKGCFSVSYNPALKADYVVNNPPVTDGQGEERLNIMLPVRLETSIAARNTKRFTTAVFIEEIGIITAGCKIKYNGRCKTESEAGTVRLVFDPDFNAQIYTAALDMEAKRFNAALYGRITVELNDFVRQKIYRRTFDLRSQSDNGKISISF